MEKVIGFVLLCIANTILAFRGINFLTWEWWAIMVCIVGWSILGY